MSESPFYSQMAEIARVIVFGELTVAQVAKARGFHKSQVTRWGQVNTRAGRHWRECLQRAREAYARVLARKVEGVPTVVPAGCEDWELYKFRFTRPQLEVETALQRVDQVIFRASNRNGKTACVVAIAGRAMYGHYPWAKVPVSVCIVSLSKPQASSAIQPYLEQFFMTLPDWADAATAGKYEQKARRTTREELTSPIRLANGSLLMVKTAEMGWEQLQGGGYDLVIFDEEPDAQTYKEMRIRLKAGQTTQKRLFTLTPLKGETWIKEKLEGKPTTRVVTAAIYENGAGVCQTCTHSREQWDQRLVPLKLTREAKAHLTLKSLCARCHTFGVEPNYPQAVLDDLETEYQGPEFAVRFYGEWANLQGGKCFHPEEILALQANIGPPETTEGGIQCWAAYDARCTYTVGVDAAEGLGGDRDETVVDVVNASRGEQVVCWGDNTVKPKDYTPDIVDLSLEYGSAAICAESLGEGRVVNETLKSQNVVLYRHRSPDRRYFTSGEDIGWRPSQRGRDLLLRNCFAAIRKNLYRDAQGQWHAKAFTYPKDHPHYPDPAGLVIHDQKTLDQLASLVFNAEKANRIEPPGHKHDDRVFGLALAHEARMSRTYTVAEVPPPGQAQSSLHAWAAEIMSEDAPVHARARDSEPQSVHPLDLLEA